MKPNLQAVMDCSFCAKEANKVACMIAGPKVFICDECVVLCGEIVAEHRVIARMKASGQIFVTKSDAERLAWMRTWSATPPETTRQGEGRDG